MKKSGALVAICLVVLCVFGWFSAVSDIFTEGSKYSKLMDTADDYVERGLYQRAIVNYEEAYAEKPSQGIYEKINSAYRLRLEEAPEATINNYMSFLANAVSAYPAHETFVNDHFEAYYANGKYEEVYKCLSNAIANGYDTDEVRANLRKARYAYDFKGNEFWDIKQGVGATFTVLDNTGWNLYHSEEGNLLENDYPYLSVVSKDGYFVAKEPEDSRLYDLNGMTWAIFKKEVAEAGLFGDGLIPACVDGKYAYYNDLAEEQFGGYDYAGAFCGGYAAVKNGDTWSIIDTAGEVKSDNYEDIVLDYAGRHSLDGFYIAKADGKYGIYDEDMKLETELDCSDADIYTAGGIIAVCKDGKWGFVNTDGETVIEPSYEDARSFSCGLAAVCKDGKWGFIDPEGNVVIDYRFLEVGYMNEYGLCPVRLEVETEEETESEPAEGEAEEPATEATEATDEAAAEEAESSASDTTENTETTEETEALESWKFLKLELGIIED